MEAEVDGKKDPLPNSMESGDEVLYEKTVPAPRRISTTKIEPGQMPEMRGEGSIQRPSVEKPKKKVGKV